MTLADTPKPEPEFRQQQLRKFEEKRARDFGTFLDSLWGKKEASNG